MIEASRYYCQEQALQELDTKYCTDFYVLPVKSLATESTKLP